MAIVSMDNWYNFKDGEYNLFVTIQNDNYDTPEELKEALINEEASEMFDYDWETGNHLLPEYVLEVQAYDEKLGKYVDVPENEWGEVL